MALIRQRERANGLPGFCVTLMLSGVTPGCSHCLSAAAGKRLITKTNVIIMCNSM